MSDAKTTEPAQLTLHGVMSPNVVKVAIMLDELSLPYVLRHVALFTGEQFTPTFRALNPLGKVPVITGAGLEHPLAESGAILIWLAERSGRFLPPPSAERYEVLQWLMVQMSAIGPMLGQFTHFGLLPAGSEPYALGRYRAIAQSLYTAVNDRLADREWIAGNQYSIADIATFPWAEYLERHGMKADDYPHMRRWRSMIAARAAVVQAKRRISEEFSGPSQKILQDATHSDLDRFFGRTDKVPAQDFTAVKRMR